jgi:phosphosulfolactate synthase
MKMGKFLQDVLDIPKRSEKPRKTGRTVVEVSAISEGVPVQIKLLRDCVDSVKFLVHCLWVDEELMVKSIRGYRELNIDVQIGGNPYEVAIAQGKQKQFADKVRSCGVNVIEIESHALGLSVEQMKNEVKEAKDRGFKVVGEVGAKWVEADDTREVQDRILVDRVINKMQALLNAGVDYVYWEGMVVRALIGNQLENKIGQKQLLEVAKEVGTDQIVFEVWDARAGKNSQIFAWLIGHFGPEVNIGNVALTELAGLEARRHGLGYDPAHPYIRWLGQGKPTKEWWQMPFPDYSVDIQKPPVWR